MKGSNLEAQFEEERSKLKGLVAKEGMTEQADLFGDDAHEARHQGDVSKTLQRFTTHLKAEKGLAKKFHANCNNPTQPHRMTGVLYPGDSAEEE